MLFICLDFLNIEDLSSLAEEENSLAPLRFKGKFYFDN
jgi:hypothetical protein